jgi:hypothetical protein
MEVRKLLLGCINFDILYRAQYQTPKRLIKSGVQARFLSSFNGVPVPLLSLHLIEHIFVRERVARYWAFINDDGSLEKNKFGNTDKHSMSHEWAKRLFLWKKLLAQKMCVRKVLTEFT